MNREKRAVRPRSFVFFAFVFFWLTLAGLGNMWAALSYPLKYNHVGINAGVFATVSALYGVTAAFVTIGFWRAGSRLPQAILVWGASLLIGMIAFQAMTGIAGEPMWLVVLPHILFALLIWSLFRFAQRRISPAAI